MFKRSNFGKTARIITATEINPMTRAMRAVREMASRPLYAA